MFSLKSLNVLLVDDNQNMRAIASAVLHSADIRNVYEASEGATAFDLLRRHAIDLAIVDFIMMTGHSERSRVYEARDAGVTEFIVKPITAKAVLDRLNAVIMRPRPFIKADGYIGPCRRRRETPDYAGPYRRGSDASRSNAA
jgi:DNA-binding response OmpR family regulator